MQRTLEYNFGRAIDPITVESIRCRDNRLSGRVPVPVPDGTV
jgi:hypothetical protein